MIISKTLGVVQKCTNHFTISIGYIVVDSRGQHAARTLIFLVSGDGVCDLYQLFIYNFFQNLNETSMNADGEQIKKSNRMAIS